MNEITIGDKTYISAKRAAEITGYARDYVGQLCREGHVDAKMVGRSWYVYEPAIRAHRFGPEAIESAQKKDMAADSTAPAAQNASSLAVEEREQDPAWEKPTYTAESPELLPELQAHSLEELLPPAEETLTDMQAAWREWFEQRQTELKTPEIESPEVIDERNEAHETAHEVEEASEEAVEEEGEVSIPLHHIDEAQKDKPAEEEIVAIRSIEPVPAPAPTPLRASHVDIARNTEPTGYTVEPAAQIEHGKIVSERIVKPQDRQNARAKGNRGSRRKARNGSYAPVIALLVGVSLIAIAVAAIGTGYATRYLSTLPTKNSPIIKYLVGTRDFNRQ